MSLALQYWMGDVHHCSGLSEMTYTVSSGTLNSTIPYHTLDTVQPSILRKTVLCLVASASMVLKSRSLWWADRDCVRCILVYCVCCRFCKRGSGARPFVEDVSEKTCILCSRKNVESCRKQFYFHIVVFIYLRAKQSRLFTADALLSPLLVTLCYLYSVSLSLW